MFHLKSGEALHKDRSMVNMVDTQGKTKKRGESLAHLENETNLCAEKLSKKTKEDVISILFLLLLRLQHIQVLDDSIYRL